MKLSAINRAEKPPEEPLTTIKRCEIDDVDIFADEEDDEEEEDYPTQLVRRWQQLAKRLSPRPDLDLDAIFGEGVEFVLLNLQMDSALYLYHLEEDEKENT
jgi:hypothetical protein